MYLIKSNKIMSIIHALGENLSRKSSYEMLNLFLFQLFSYSEPD